MAKYRSALPQLSGGLFLTDGVVTGYGLVLESPRADARGAPRI
jgi:hypothetical protein